MRIFGEFMEIFVLYFILASAVVPITLRRFASNEWKGCFQWTEALFPKSGSRASDGWKNGRDWGLPYTGMVDTGDYKITGLHPIFCALDFFKCIIILYIYIIIYIYIYNNKYT